MKRLCVFVSLWLFFVCACGPNLSSFDSIITHQPRVIAVEPADGLTAPSKTAVKIVFSMPIDPTSIGPNSFSVINIEENLPKPGDLAEDISKGETTGCPGNYNVSDNWREVTFEPDPPFSPGTYGIIVTMRVQTTASLPLNQTPGGTPTPFWSTFTVKDEGSVNDGGSEETETNGGGNNEGEAGGNGQDNNSEEGVAENEQDSSSSPPGPQRPTKLVINEILYDASGDELDGNLFVELAGDAGGDIGNYKILFINGADGAVTETIDIAAGSIIGDDQIFLIADSRTGAPTQTNIPGADFLDNFDPQNGPDCVQLQDNHGALLDAVGYGTPLPQNAQNGLACFEGTSGPDASAGKSISRTGGADSNNNAADFKILNIPTPGIL